MLFYVELQQMDGKWNDKWAIMGRKWMKYMSISDEKWTIPGPNTMYQVGRAESI